MDAVKVMNLIELIERAEAARVIPDEDAPIPSTLIDDIKARALQDIQAELLA